MADGLASGVTVIGSFEPIQLYAGEAPINGWTEQGVLAANQKVGQKNARGDTFKFPIVALVGAQLVAWDPLADGDVPNAFASGTFTFATAVPTPAETVTINGDVITFRAAADPALAEVTIGATLAATAANLANYINSHRNTFADAFPVIASVSGAVVTVKAPGVAGNAVTLAEATANVTTSGATLAGGTDSDAESGGARRPVGILPHALDTTVTGYNAAVNTPYLIGGDFNFAALDVPVGTTLAELKAAFSRSAISVKSLY